MDKINPFVSEILSKKFINSLDNYDVIGFDVDHCLVQYNVPNLHKMTYFGLCNTLIKDKNYPNCIKELSEEKLNFPLNAAICDFLNGYTIKMGENGLILRAYKGFSLCSIDEVFL